MNDISNSELNAFILSAANRYASLIVIYMKDSPGSFPPPVARAAMELVETYESEKSNENDVWIAYYDLIKTASEEGIDLNNIILDMLHSYIQEN